MPTISTYANPCRVCNRRLAKGVGLVEGEFLYCIDCCPSAEPKEWGVFDYLSDELLSATTFGSKKEAEQEAKKWSDSYVRTWIQSID